MEERTQNILEAAVREFIRIGEPVSSRWLYDNYDFGIKPAMIRFELNALTDHGYLAQPHHSSGRVPTNRGYEFFAEHILESEAGGTAFDRRLGELFEKMEWRDFLTELSRDLGLLGIAAEPREGLVHKDGLENLVAHLEWKSRSEIKAVIRDFEEFEERLGAAREVLADDDFIKVFIGRKSPVTRSECLAVVAGDYEAENERILLFAIGPKRMDYEKTARIFKGLKHTETL